MPFLQELLQKATVSGSRSTALNPLAWLVAILASATIASSTKSPAWITAMLGIGTAFGIALYLVSYIFFMRKNPDYLRSERYSIQKLAIEKGIVGDSVAGVLELSAKANPPKLPPPTNADSENAP